MAISDGEHNQYMPLVQGVLPGFYTFSTRGKCLLEGNAAFLNSANRQPLLAISK